MRLHARLVFPLLVGAVVLMAAGIVGMTLLMRGMVDVVFQQSGKQWERVAEHALRTRAQRLNEIATVFAALRGDVAVRDRSWKHDLLDTAVVLDGRTGRVLSSMGLPIDPADLREFPAAVPSGVPILRVRNGVVVAGIASGKKGSEVVIVGQKLGVEFARQLKELVRADVDIGADGSSPISTLTDPPAEAETYSVKREFLTPAKGVFLVTMHLPARELKTARRKAIYLTLAGGVFLLLAVVAFYAYALFKVTRPISDLIGAVEKVRAGDLSTELAGGAPAELGALVREFNRMARSLKETQERLVHSAKLSSVGQLVAGISHELNNPLLGLLGNAEQAAAKLPPDDPARAKMDTVIREGGRMKRILEELRNFTRPSTREHARIDMNLLLKETLALTKKHAEEAKVKCSTNLAEKGAFVTGSPDHLRQVLLNLVLNALEAMPDGGSLKVTTERAARDGKGLCVTTITDTGQGMPPELLGQVTEPFFSTKHGRMGLGLAICREIADQHGGSLVVESRKGEGTSVHLKLPEGENR